MPIPYVSEPYSTYTPDSGNITVNHNHYFKLTCKSGKFKSFTEENPTEITVKCLEGRSVQYNKYAYEYDYFECDDTQRLLAARKAFRKIFVPKTRKTRPIRKLYIMIYKYFSSAYLTISIILKIQRLSHDFKYK